MAMTPLQDHIVSIDGAGRFIVNGDIILNSAGCAANYIDEGDCVSATSLSPGHPQKDLIEALRDSRFIVYGHVVGVQDPFDWCFYSPPFQNTQASPEPQYPGLTVDPLSPPAIPPTNAADCRGARSHARMDGGYVYFNHLDVKAPGSAVDPYAGIPVPTLTSNPSPCGGTYNAAGNGWTGGVAPAPRLYSPGVYNYPVVVNTNATFADCGGGAPGIYVFNKGVEVCPGVSGQAVTGSNIMLYSAQRFQGRVAAERCPGAGRGQDGDNADIDDSPDWPVGPASYPTSPPNDLYSTDGDAPNDLSVGMYLGGVPGTTVTLSAPTSGPYADVLMFQDRNAPANTGLDATQGSGAAIDLTGAVYNVSMPSDPRFQVSYRCDFAPAEYGGRLIAGWRPCASATGGTTANMTIHGSAVVGVFYVPGDGTLTVDAAATGGRLRLVR
jgi:hypothetical protein